MHATIMDDIHTPPPPYSSNVDHSLHYASPIIQTTQSDALSRYARSSQHSRENRRNNIHVAFWLPHEDAEQSHLGGIYAHEHPQYPRLPQNNGARIEQTSFEDAEQRLLGGSGPWEGQRVNGGIQLPNAYIENNGDARGVEIERRNPLET
jgi:hypothetical protein